MKHLLNNILELRTSMIRIRTNIIEKGKRKVTWGHTKETKHYMKVGHIRATYELACVTYLTQRYGFWLVEFFAICKYLTCTTQFITTRWYKRTVNAMVVEEGFTYLKFRNIVHRYCERHADRPSFLCDVT